MAEQVLVTVNVEGDIVEGQGNVFQDVSKGADQATESTKGLTKSVTENGGAMGILNMLTGGYAQVAKDALESTELFKGGLKAATLQAKLFGNATRTALTATGIGAIVVAVGLLVTYWDEIQLLVTGTNDEIEKQNALLDKTTKITDINQSKAQANFDIQVLKNAELRKEGELTQFNLASERYLFQQLVKEKKTAADAEAARLKNAILLEEEGSKERLDAVAALAKFNIQRRVEEQSDINKLRDLYRQQTSEEIEAAKNKTKEKIAGNKKSTEEEKLDLLALNEFETSLLQQGIVRELEENENARLRAVEQAKELGADVEEVNRSFAERDLMIRESYQAEKDEIKERDIQTTKLTEQQKADYALSTAQAVTGAIMTLAGENEAAQKALGITSVIIDTARGIMGAWAQVATLTPYGAAAVSIGIGAAGIANIAKINNASANSAGGFDTGRGVTNSIPTNDNATATPNFYIPTNTGEGVATDVGGNNLTAPTKVYVTTKDINSAEELDRMTENTQGLG